MSTKKRKRSQSQVTEDDTMTPRTLIQTIFQNQRTEVPVTRKKSRIQGRRSSLGAPTTGRKRRSLHDDSLRSRSHIETPRTVIQDLLTNAEDETPVNFAHPKRLSRSAIETRSVQKENKTTNVTPQTAVTSFLKHAKTEEPVHRAVSQLSENTEIGDLGEIEEIEAGGSDIIGEPFISLELTGMADDEESIVATDKRWTVHPRTDVLRDKLRKITSTPRIEEPVASSTAVPQARTRQHLPSSIKTPTPKKIESGACPRKTPRSHSKSDHLSSSRLASNEKSALTKSNSILEDSWNSRDTVQPSPGISVHDPQTSAVGITVESAPVDNRSKQSSVAGTLHTPSSQHKSNLRNSETRKSLNESQRHSVHGSQSALKSWLSKSNRTVNNSVSNAAIGADSRPATPSDQQPQTQRLSELFIRNKAGYKPLVIPEFKKPLSVTKIPPSNNSESTVTKKTTPRKPKQAKDNVVERIPKSHLKNLVKMFSKSGTVSNDVIDEIELVTDKYWKNLREDIAAYADHADRKTITWDDVELLFRRQGLVTQETSMETLIRENLPLEYRAELIPCATANGKVKP